MIYGYFSVDNEEMNGEQAKALNLQLREQYGIEFTQINMVNDTILYLGVLREPKKIEDFEVIAGDEIEIRPGLKTIFAARNIKVLGVFTAEGLPYGQTYVLDKPAVYSEEDIISEATYKIVGEILYPINEAAILELMPEIPDQISEDGETIISTKKPTDLSSLKGYLGYKRPL